MKIEGLTYDPASTALLDHLDGSMLIAQHCTSDVYTKHVVPFTRIHYLNHVGIG